MSRYRITAAINGSRALREHPAIPISPEQQAAQSAAAVASGAAAIHVHVRDSAGRESLAAADVAVALESVRAACPGIPVSISTGAWIVLDVEERLDFIRAWQVLPDAASVNLHEPGAQSVMRLLIERGIGVEAGLWNADAAVALCRSGMLEKCQRLLLEPGEEPGETLEKLEQIEAALGATELPRLLHGLDDSAWPMVALAFRRGYETRIGFEDTLIMPDGTAALSNAELVRAALSIGPAESEHFLPVDFAVPGSTSGCSQQPSQENRHEDHR